MVCRLHWPESRYEVTRAILAKVEDLLSTAAHHARHDKRPGDPDIEMAILEISIKVAKLRSTEALR
jgi:hypothetical protein